jgi:hypothetical protein
MTRLIFVGVFAFAVAGCGDDTVATGLDMAVSTDMSMTCGGGPVTGAMDRHCYDPDAGAMFGMVDPAQCTVDAGPSTGPQFGDTMYNTSGNDDDCKYFVSYVISTTGICKNNGTFFTVTLKDATTMAAIAHANNVRPEVFNTATMAPVSTASSMTTETSNGVYKIGPVTFTTAGNYTVRFHFYENCTDTPTSPHGHAAFFVTVP